MLEIFIPTRIFDKFSINILDEKICKNLQNSFKNLKISEISDEFISGKLLEIPNYDEDLIIFCNGFCGKFYAFDADFEKHKIESFWKVFYKNYEYFDDLQKIEKQIFEIKNFLESEKLLTNSKKTEILETIKYIFFLLSILYFHIFSLLAKTQKNISELSEKSWKSDLDATANLLLESAKTKEIELESARLNLENYIKNFSEIIFKQFLL